MILQRVTFFLKALPDQRHEHIHLDNVEDSRTMDSIKEDVAKQIGLPPKSFRFSYRGTVMEGERTLASYEIIEGSFIACVTAVIGGSCMDTDPVRQALIRDETTSQRLILTPEYAKAAGLTISGEKDDCIMGDHDAADPCAQLPCGHWIRPATAYQFTLSCYYPGGAGEFLRLDIPCPAIVGQSATLIGPRIKKCEKIWPWHILKKIARFETKETEAFEKKAAREKILLDKNMKECPKCSSLIFNDQRGLIRVRCQVCVKKGVVQDFCWVCLGDWKGSSPASCGNKNCGHKPLNEMLQSAGTRTTTAGATITFPAIRACPNCLKTGKGIKLYTHVEMCKEVSCSICAARYCFSCLAIAENGRLPESCGGSGKVCTVAPKQTVDG